jgi:hypothetical protein
VRCGIAGDIADVVSDTIPGDAHPVFHRRTGKFPTFGNFVLRGVGIAIDQITVRIIDFAVSIGFLVVVRRGGKCTIPPE